MLCYAEFRALGDPLNDAPYTPPADLWEVNRSLQLDEPLDGSDDPRWVDTAEARGEYSLRSLYRALGVEGAQRGFLQLREPPSRGYYLFCGHRGCGKSTELRRIRNSLHAPHVYYVAFADAARDLDPNNLRYQDVLLHLAATLTRQLENDGILIDQVHLGCLQRWFDRHVLEKTEIEEFTTHVKAEAQVDAGLPFLGKLLAAISTAFKTNATHKDVLRRTLKNYFSDFAEAFNHLIAAAEDALEERHSRSRILFVIDGTDRLSEEDAHAFFITDAHQLQQVTALFVYCAPIHLIYEAAVVQQNFTVFRLPMIKIEDAEGSAGRDAMRNLLHLRAAPALFDPGVADYLINCSGGHPRDLLRLLQQAFQYAERDRFDDAAARRAVREAASVFRRILEPDDYRLLAEVDSVDPGAEPPPSTERARHLLYNLALLEYNDYYWRSHPVVRTIDAYDTARQRIGEVDRG